ncbi:MAG: hypothetical protein ABIP46_12970 [Polaromonas sp.]
MRHTLNEHSATDQTTETHRHAYNVAFDELGLSWHWDSATYARLQTHSNGCVATYLQTEQAHLLRAYEADFLVQAIETAKARCYHGMTAGRAYPALHASSANASRSRQAA